MKYIKMHVFKVVKFESDDEIQLLGHGMKQGEVVNRKLSKI